MGARALKVSRTESYAAGRSAAAASRVPPPPPLTTNIVASVRACVRMTNAARALTAKLDGVRGENDADYLLALQQIRIESRASRPTDRSSGNVFIIYHTLTLLRNPRTHARTHLCEPILCRLGPTACRSPFDFSIARAASSLTAIMQCNRMLPIQPMGWWYCS